MCGLAPSVLTRSQSNVLCNMHRDARKGSWMENLWQNLQSSRGIRGVWMEAAPGLTSCLNLMLTLLLQEAEFLCSESPVAPGLSWRWEEKQNQIPQLFHSSEEMPDTC